MIDPITDAEKTLIAGGQDEGLRQVIAQLTKNLIDGSMNLQRYKIQLEEAVIRSRTGRLA